MRALLFVVVVMLAGGAVWASAMADRTDREERGSEPASRDRATPGGKRKAERARARARARAERRRARARQVPRSTCPAGLSGCASVRGRVIFVESVDPDGDGDLHVVLTGGSVTAAGITAVDVKPALRPRRDPRIGDRVSAAGQVQRGSFGQSQIHAVEFHVRRG